MGNFFEPLTRQQPFKRASKNTLSIEKYGEIHLASSAIDRLEKIIEHYDKNHDEPINVNECIISFDFYYKRVKKDPLFSLYESNLLVDFVETQLPLFIDADSFDERAGFIMGAIKTRTARCDFSLEEIKNKAEIKVFLYILEDYVKSSKKEPFFNALPVEWQLDIVCSGIPYQLLPAASKKPKGNKNG